MIKLAFLKFSMPLCEERSEAWKGRYRGSGIRLAQWGRQGVQG